MVRLSAPLLAISLSRLFLGVPGGVYLAYLHACSACRRGLRALRRGGGYGPPYERPAEIVAREVREGLVSPAGARRYGVLLTDKLEADMAGTEAVRAGMRARKNAEGREEGSFEIDRGGTLADAFAGCEAEVR